MYKLTPDGKATAFVFCKYSPITYICAVVTLVEMCVSVHSFKLNLFCFLIPLGLTSTVKIKYKYRIR